MRGLNASISSNRLYFDEAYNIDLSFICAGNKRLEEKLRKEFNKKENVVKFYDSEIDGINEKNPAKTNCKMNISELIRDRQDYVESFDVHILIPKSYNVKSVNNLIHNESHEIFHVFSGIIPPLMKDSKNYIKTNTSIYYNAMGCIGYFSNKENKRYGTMFKETITDLLASAAVAYDGKYNINNTSVNEVFNKKSNSIQRTGYTDFLSLTRLAIAAFNNCSDFNYDEKLLNNDNIFFGYREINREVIMDNDLLYGYIANPLYIKQKWEEIKGIDSYDQFAESLDNMFDNYLRTGKVDKDSIKSYMNEITDFLNKKLDIYVRLGKITFEEATDIATIYNNIWNEIQSEFNVPYTSEEIRKYADFKRLNYLYQTQN